MRPSSILLCLHVGGQGSAACSTAAELQLQESSSKCWKGPFWVSASCLHLRGKRWFSFVPGAIARKVGREKEAVPFWSEKQRVLLPAPRAALWGVCVSVNSLMILPFVPLSGQIHPQ